MCESRRGVDRVQVDWKLLIMQQHYAWNLCVEDDALLAGCSNFFCGNVRGEVVLDFFFLLDSGRGVPSSRGAN